jgi:hypothetical protein
MGLAGAAVALVLYYRDFLGMVADVAPRLGAPAASRYPVESFLLTAYRRTRDFFDGVYPLLAAGGLWLLCAEDAPAPSEARRDGRRALLLAWTGAYALLLLGRAKAPDIFLHGHETLLVTPLVCLAAGHALAWLYARGAAARAAAILVAIFLAVQGLWGQWSAVAAQLGNAR